VLSPGNDLSLLPVASLATCIQEKFAHTLRTDSFCLFAEIVQVYPA
jgi:hypothetical protein